MTATQNNGNYFSWKFDPGVAGSVRLEYDVVLEHDQYEWPFGVEEIAYKTSQGFMIVGRYLFLVPDFDETQPYEVKFELPASWKVSTPWAAGEEVFKYSGLSASEVRDNVLFFGSHEEEKVAVSSTVLRLVL